MVLTRGTVGSFDEDPRRKFFTLFILGFLTMIVGLVLLEIAAIVSQGGSTSFGGIIFIGPNPHRFRRRPRSTVADSVCYYPSSSKRHNVSDFAQKIRA